MGRLFKIYLSGSHIYVCSKCNTHLSRPEEIVSKAFRGKHGPAYLFSKVVNVSAGPQEDRILITGLHTVADIFCNECQSCVGWTYYEAFEETQKYKEGKFILEKGMITKTN
eukprot:TRINITY_DN639_c0_g1_i2.p1 TRINITY_DN639_c0_g1~~TRINITY_DN639_c0_g1_i2.p1  ORF type:complete len:111 (+),score=6.08 TRINITY_DN639_c0_g1_i2:99-431(+)